MVNKQELIISELLKKERKEFIDSNDISLMDIKNWLSKYLYNLSGKKICLIEKYKEFR